MPIYLNSRGSHRSWSQNSQLLARPPNFQLLKVFEMSWIRGDQYCSDLSEG